MLEIMASNPLPKIDDYVSVLLEKHQKRTLFSISAEFHKRIAEDEDASSVKLWLEQSMAALASGDYDTRAKSYSELKKEVLSAPPIETVWVGFGFIDQPLSLSDFDENNTKRSGGFETGRLVLLMGDPEAGKTMLAVQMMKNISQNEIVLFFAFEFTVRSFVRTQIRVEGSDYENHNLEIIDKGYDIADIVKELTFWRKRGCRFVVIDSQMRVSNVSKKRATSEEVETEKFSILAKACRNLDLTLVYICQQGKEDAKGGVITPMGSKKGGHEADIIIYLKKEKDSEDREIIFNKNKQSGKHFKKDITFDRSSMSFRAIHKEHQKGKGDAVPLSEAEKRPVDVVVKNADGSVQKRMELK